MMRTPDWEGPLTVAHEAAAAFLDSLPERPVRTEADRDTLVATLGGPLPDVGEDPRHVVERLARDALPGIMPSPSGRFFGFVVGGSHPAALAADWLVSTWDQNAGLFVLSPATSVIEDVAADWLRDLFGLPPESSFGFVTGAQGANTVALAAARHEVLDRAGWNVEVDGLSGAPRLRVLAGRDRHDTIDRALRFLGIGTAALEPVGSDALGRMSAADLATALADGDPAQPVIVCAQAGNVNTGAVDPLADICHIAHDAGAWVHVDGAFGLWAAATPRLAPLLNGVDQADSWATDAHKWLNVPYDCGIVFCAHPAAHQAAMGVRAAYLIHADGPERDEVDWNPEFSRRARSIPVYAALRSLGRRGVADLVERGCTLAQRFADGFAAMPGAVVLTEVTLNQVLVGFRAPAASDSDDDAWTRQVIDRIAASGSGWFSGTTWRGRAAMRVSVTNWTTDEKDVDAVLDQIAAICEAAAPRAR